MEKLEFWTSLIDEYILANSYTPLPQEIDSDIPEDVFWNLIQKAIENVPVRYDEEEQRYYIIPPEAFYPPEEEDNEDEPWNYW